MNSFLILTMPFLYPQQGVLGLHCQWLLFLSFVFISMLQVTSAFVIWYWIYEICKMSAPLVSLSLILNTANSNIKRANWGPGSYMNAENLFLLVRFLRAVSRNVPSKWLTGNSFLCVFHSRSCYNWNKGTSQFWQFIQF